MKQTLLYIAIFFWTVQLEAKTKQPVEVSNKAPYVFVNEPIDVVIPCIEKDKETLDLCIQGIKENCKQVRNVYVISSKKLTDKAIWFNEKKFPFTKKKIALCLFQGNKKRARKYLPLPGARAGWYFQQLVKLYAPFVIPKISSNVLVLDADTIFLKPVVFQNSLGGALFNPSIEFHAPYFQHADKLTGGKVKRLFPKHSGISHHMLLQKCILSDLFKLVESTHRKKLWKAFCSCIKKEDIHAGASEYELYFNFALSTTDRVEIRPLLWANLSSLALIPQFKLAGFDYVSCHTFIRK